MNKKNVLVIGDTHIPYTHKDYLKFLKKVQRDYDCGTVIHIGDLVDFNGLSYHEKDPDLPGPEAEVQLVKKLLKPWFKAFPKLMLCYGNHDRLPMRKTKSMGLPSRFIKSLAEVLGCPAGWTWHNSIILDGVMYFHGDGVANPTSSLRKATTNGIRIVHGHIHTSAGVNFMATEGQLLWSMNSGCGIDRHQKAFDYQKYINVKPILGCGVVLNKGKQPIFIPMNLGDKMKFVGNK